MHSDGTCFSVRPRTTTNQQTHRFIHTLLSLFEMYSEIERALQGRGHTPPNVLKDDQSPVAEAAALLCAGASSAASMSGWFSRSSDFSWRINYRHLPDSSLF